MRFLVVGLPFVAMHTAYRMLVRGAPGEWQLRGTNGQFEAQYGNLANGVDLAQVFY